MYSGVKFSITGSCHQFGGPVKEACGRFPMRAGEHKGGSSAEPGLTYGPQPPVGVFPTASLLTPSIFKPLNNIP